MIAELEEMAQAMQSALAEKHRLAARSDAMLTLGTAVRSHSSLSHQVTGSGRGGRPGQARIPEFLQRVGSGERRVRNRQLQEAAERCPAFGDVEHQETLGRDLRIHFSNVPTIDRKGRGLVQWPAAHGSIDE